MCVMSVPWMENSRFSCWSVALWSVQRSSFPPSLSGTLISISMSASSTHLTQSRSIRRACQVSAFLNRDKDTV